MFYLFAVLVGFVGFQLGRSKDKNHPPIKLLSAGAVELPPEPPPLSFLDVLDRVMGSDRPPSLQLLQAAYQEAVATGNEEMVYVVKDIARNMFPPVPAPQEQQPPEDGDEVLDEENGSAEEWGELANPDVAEPVAKVVPIDGVDPDSWSTFCEALRTRKPEWSSDNHLGTYEHRKTRLRQLGIDASALNTEQAQYDALCADIADYHRNCNKMVKDFVGSQVEVGGSKHPVTASGVLGLLKAAGPKGAEGWLRNVEDRTRFPRTTEVFLRCNGSF